MPKVLVREIDKTDPGRVLTQNFSVVVPGKCGTEGESSDKFDENGVYECLSVEDFDKYIGKTAAIQTAAEGLDAEPEEIGEDGEVISTLSAHDFYITYYGNIYTVSATTDTTKGKLKFTVGDGSTAKRYKATKLTGDAEWDAEKDYCVILDNKTGVDGSNILQIGNQLAYELLRLGYTVLFKKFDSVAEIGENDFWDCLKDKSTYDFRYVVSGIVDEDATADPVASTIYGRMKDLVDGSEGTHGRGDCIALLDVPESVYEGQTSSNAVESIKGYSSCVSNAYCLWFAPTWECNSIILDTAFNNNKKFPASFYYLACASRSLQRYPEWFAISGYTRGISDLAVEGVSAKLGDKAVEVLQPRTNHNAVNIIISEKNNYYLWGNRTALNPGADGLVASNFANIRQLCTTLKKQIYTVCRSLMFSPNSDLLWLNFCNAIRPTLENMKAQQGIKDYKFEKKETSLKAKLFAAVRIIPIEAVEDFEIAVTMEDEDGFEVTSIHLDEKLVD